MTPQSPVREAPIIPAPNRGVTVLCVHAFVAILAGLAVRLLFAFKFPTSVDDSEIYLQLARNWADFHIYGLWAISHLVPTDIRTPGYPAFLAGVAMILRRSMRAIVLSQAAIDLGTCLFAAALSAVMAPVTARRRAAIAGLWLAATCPFVANYSAVVLTEVLATFLATAALLSFAVGLLGKPAASDMTISFGTLNQFSSALLGSFLTGIATLVRPEMPLLVAVAVVVYSIRWWKFLSFRKLILAGAAMACAFLLPLAPWAARNLITLHKFQLVAPRYATMPGEFVPVGYYAWTKTWLERYRDVYLTVWQIEEGPLSLDDLPPQAFDSRQEKTRVADLYEQYNESANFDFSPDMDREFAEIARERTARHPLRTYLTVPFQRALTIWFTPRTELLPIDGKLWPVREQWNDSHAAFLTTAGLGALGYIYVALALGGIWVVWRARRAETLELNMRDVPNLWGVALIIVYLIVRTVFLTTVESPEPRYVVSCYPALLALAAQLFALASSHKSE